MRAIIETEGELQVGDVLTVCEPRVICAKPVKEVVGMVPYPVYREHKSVTAGGLPIMPMTAKIHEGYRFGIAEFALLLAFIALIVSCVAIGRCWSCHDAD